jgi:hypothetical protein
MVDKTGSPVFKILPLNERQARPLTYIPMEQQRETWTMVIEESEQTDSRITASFIERCIDKLRQKKVSTVIRKERETGDKLSSLPKSFQQSYQNFMDELQSTNEETFEPKSRKEIAKVLREILETLEN